MDWHIIIGPLVGAVIGLVTNALAIKMIFRPLYPKYIGKWRIPFTPGLIPKERGRLAKSIGNVISQNLVSTEVLEKTLLSEDMLSKVRGVLEKFVLTLKNETCTLREYLYGIFTERDTESAVAAVKGDASRFISHELLNPQIGETVSHMIMGHVITRVREGLLGMFGADKILELIAESAEELLAGNINGMLSENSEKLVSDILETEAEKLMNMRVCDIVSSKEDAVGTIQEWILSSYVKLVKTQLPRILATINISAMVERRVNEMDVHEVEQLVMGIMNKELKAIVWLGGLLGFLMGFLNI